MDAGLQPLMVPREALRPPSADGKGTGVAISLLAHALLVAGLTLSVQWHTQDPEGVEAELWAATPQIAAPAEVSEPPKPTPKPEPAPPPAAVQPPPPPPAAATQQRDADIAIEQEKKRKAREEEARQEAEDQRAREKRQQADRDRKAQAAKAEAQKKQEAEAEEKAEAERLAAEKKAKAKADEKAKADQAKKDKSDAERREAQRQDNIRRMNAQLGGDGAADSTGTAARSAGPSANYAGRIKAYIKPNIVLTDPVPGNPMAEVEVRVGPDGSIIGRKLNKPSGNTAWDEAVLRAIDRTGKLPRDTDGTVPPRMIISFKPSE